MYGLFEHIKYRPKLGASVPVSQECAEQRSAHLKEKFLFTCEKRPFFTSWLSVVEKRSVKMLNS